MQHLLEKIKQLWIGLELNQSKDLINEEWVAKLIKSAVKRNTNGNHAYYYNMHIHYLLISDSFDLHSQVYFRCQYQSERSIIEFASIGFILWSLTWSGQSNSDLYNLKLSSFHKTFFNAKITLRTKNAIIHFIVVSVKNKQIYTYRALLSG